MNHAALKRQLTRHEGRRIKPYPDSEGILTIGIGRNLERGLSADEIDYLYENDVNQVVDILRRKNYWQNLNDVRQRVLVGMVFNLGWQRFTGFRMTIKALRRKDFDEAAVEMLDSKWARQVKGRAVRLAKMMKTGTDEVFL